MLYGRCALWFTVTGLSQAAPYFGTFGFFGSLAPQTGGYSKRLFTVAIEENLAAWSWIVAGIFFLAKWYMTKGQAGMKTVMPADPAGMA